LGAGCDVISLAEKFRRARADDPQLLMFPEEMAYQSYRKYCAIVMVPPADYDTWRTCRSQIFP